MLNSSKIMQKMIIGRRSGAALYSGWTVQLMRRAGARGTDKGRNEPGHAGSEAAAGRVQIGQMAVSRIETGKRVVPDFELPVIAGVLGVSTDWLLGKE